MTTSVPAVDQNFLHAVLWLFHHFSPPHQDSDPLQYNAV